MCASFPCNYTDRGCDVEMRGDDIVEHEKRCKFGESDDFVDVELEKIEIED